MSYAGEEPITSFFNRVSSREKRKESPAIRKRKRFQAGTEANTSSTSGKKPKVQKKLVLHDIARNRGIPDIAKVAVSCRDTAEGSVLGRTDSLVSIPRESSTTPPPVETLSRAGSATTSRIQDNNPHPTPMTARQPGLLHASDFLQTPPPTILQTKKKVSHLSENLQIIKPSPNTPTPRISTNLLPTPATMARRHRSRADDAIDHEPSSSPDMFSYLQPSALNSGDKFVRPGVKEPLSRTEADGSQSDDCDDNRPSLTESQKSIPSSQSQNDGFKNVSSLRHSTRNRPEPSTSRQSPVFRIPHLPKDLTVATSSSVKASRIEDKDGYEFVHSSQSQHMLPFHVSPRKDRSLTGYSYSSSPIREGATTSPIEEVIPSSQSQTEDELDVSKRISDYLHRMPPMERTSIDERLPSSHFDWRTSAPILSQQASQDEGQCLAHVHETVNDEVMQEKYSLDLPLPESGFATEDESDNEDDAAIPDVHCSSSVPQHLSAANDTQSQELVEYPSSLPDVVKEFHDMFGDGVGSYPDDFPMSLR
ncbi:hypothetical protein D9615_000128 [Tricholomella constricta]|uniref:Uncharacterized protein n=1 Tax=Tricholomella constricta TaxID=117010 RepID=A0A8H5MBJ1_9AGAR|nr:hypothetical protein D9615_000128 [Tricholomella constricta]